MSVLTGKKPLSVIIFDRTQAGYSDVPVFSQKLKEKVNTPIAREVADSQLSPKTQDILQKITRASVLRADSSGGQTGEFAQRTEAPVPNSSVHTFPLVAQLQIDPPDPQKIADDPTLIRSTIAMFGLEELLQELSSLKPTIPPVVIPSSTATLLSSSHTKGVLERVILPAAHAYDLQTLIEPYWYQLRTESRRLRTRLPVITTDLRAQLAQVQSLFSLPEFNFTRFASKVMIAGSLVLMLLTVGPMVALELQSLQQKISYAISTIPTRAEDSSQTPEAVKPTPIPSPNPDPEKQFQIIIPKIGVNSKVIANVDPADEKAYTEALKKGVAHAAGTGLPGEENTNNKTIFIFGHSTNGTWNIARYNALFYSLKDLVVGDTLSIWFWGKEFHYIVKSTEIVAADDVSPLTPQTDKDQLILQTCWPPGTSWKRFLVIAEPVK